MGLNKDETEEKHDHNKNASKPTGQVGRVGDHVEHGNSSQEKDGTVSGPDRSSRGSLRGGGRGSNRGSIRGGGRGSIRGSNRGNSRGSSRGSTRGDARGSSRGNSRAGFKGTSRVRGRGGSKYSVDHDTNDQNTDENTHVSSINPTDTLETTKPLGENFEEKIIHHDSSEPKHQDKLTESEQKSNSSDHNTLPKEISKQDKLARKKSKHKQTRLDENRTSSSEKNDDKKYNQDEKDKEAVKHLNSMKKSLVNKKKNENVLKHVNETSMNQESKNLSNSKEHNVNKTMKNKEKFENSISSTSFGSPYKAKRAQRVEDPAFGNEMKSTTAKTVSRGRGGKRGGRGNGRSTRLNHHEDNNISDHTQKIQTGNPDKEENKSYIRDFEKESASDIHHLNTQALPGKHSVTLSQFPSGPSECPYTKMNSSSRPHSNSDHQLGEAQHAFPPFGHSSATHQSHPSATPIKYQPGFASHHMEDHPSSVHHSIPTSASTPSHQEVASSLLPRSNLMNTEPTRVVVNQEDHKILQESRFFKKASFSSPGFSSEHMQNQPMSFAPHPLHHHHHQQQQQQPHHHHIHQPETFHHNQHEPFPNVILHPNNVTHARPLNNNSHMIHSPKQILGRRKSSNSSSLYNNPAIRDEYQLTSYQKAAEFVFEDDYDEPLGKDVLQQTTEQGPKRQLSTPSKQTPTKEQKETQNQEQGETVSENEPTRSGNKDKPFSLDDLLRPDFLPNDNVWDETQIDISKINENIDYSPVKAKSAMAETEAKMGRGNYLKKNSSHAQSQQQAQPQQSSNVEYVEIEQQRPKEDQGPPYVVKILKLQKAFNLDKIKKLIFEPNNVEYTKYKIFWETNVDGSFNYNSKVCFFEVSSFKELVKVISKLSANKYNYVLSKALLPDFKRYMDKHNPENVPQDFQDPNEVCEGEIVLYDPVTRKPIGPEQTNPPAFQTRSGQPSGTTSSPTLAVGDQSFPRGTPGLEGDNLPNSALGEATPTDSATSTPKLPMFSFAEIAAKAKLAKEAAKATSSYQTVASSPSLTAKNSVLSPLQSNGKTASPSPSVSKTNVSYSTSSSKTNPMASRLHSPSPLLGGGANSTMPNGGSSLNNANTSSYRNGGRSYTPRNGNSSNSTNGGYQGNRHSQSPTRSFGLACSFITGSGGGNGNGGTYRKYRKN